MKAWRDDLEELRALRRDGMSFSQIGRIMGRSRGSVAKAVWAYVLENGHGHGPRSRRRGFWDETDLIEPYAEFKRRREHERSQAASAPRA